MKEKDIIKKIKVWELDRWYKKTIYVFGWISIIWLSFWFFVGFAEGAGII